MVEGAELRWVSERHLRVRVGSDTSIATHRRVRAAFERLRGSRVSGVTDLVPAYATVLVEFEVDGLDEGEAERAVLGALGSLDEYGAAPGRLVEVPVCYGGEFGPDLADVARLHGMTPERVAEVHAGAEYLVHFIGFVPGFAYMGGLPAEIATSRLERPRVRVPAGSVGIAGEQTGVYPFVTPGGWRLIGRTPLKMFDAWRERASLLEMGDRVRFVGVGRGEFEKIASSSVLDGVIDSVTRAPASPPGTVPQGGTAGARPHLRVIDPGMLTTVQDLGRRGMGAIGVCTGGAADWASLIAGNRAVGNEDGAAGLEMTLRGCVVEFEGEAVVVGAGASIQGAVKREVKDGEVVQIAPGERLSVGRLGGARAYLCVAGGIDVPRMLGCRSTHLSAGFGGAGRAIKAGDDLAVGTPSTGIHSGQPKPVALRPVPRFAEARLLRIVVSESGEFDSGSMTTFLESEYRVASQSDRVGLRLEGPRIESRSGGRMISEGMMWGAVQIPEDGRPIVLNVDYPVTGGYPVIGCIAAADQPVLGQLKPGDVMRFGAVSREEARVLYRERRKSLDSAGRA